MKTRLDQERERLYIGWEGYCIRRRKGRVWWWCSIIAFDDNEPVVKTSKGYYHRRPLADWRFFTSVFEDSIIKGEPRAT